jgi:hypothetical protein
MAQSESPPLTPSTLFYRALLACALVVAAIAVIFFVIGIADGSVSSFNIGIWLLLLSCLGAILGAGHALRTRGRTGWAIAVLSIAAVPGIIGGLLVLLVVITQPRWN